MGRSNEHPESRWRRFYLDNARSHRSGGTGTPYALAGTPAANVRRTLHEADTALRPVLAQPA